MLVLSTCSSLYNSFAKKGFYDSREKEEERSCNSCCLLQCYEDNRVPITMIGKTKESSFTTGNSWPVSYMQKNNDWSDAETLNIWDYEIFEFFVRKITKIVLSKINSTLSIVLLILNNTPCHSKLFEQNKINVVFFSPNVTSWKQTMDMSIIAAMKKQYKYLLIKNVITHDL